jgi:hypothetical protein
MTTLTEAWELSRGDSGLAVVSTLPDDPQSGLDDDGLRRLLRDIFTAAGGTHDDWSEYDRMMCEQRRTAVLIAPSRIYGNETLSPSSIRRMSDASKSAISVRSATEVS